VKKNSFELLELEMADLERFWRKTPLGPLGVKSIDIRLKSWVKNLWKKCQHKENLIFTLKNITK
jgi:hypothetical protein